MYNPYDFYFQQAKKLGYKARSAFKLAQIDQKYTFFNKQSKYVLDLGCAPGSWSQYTCKRLQELNITNFKIIGLDLQKIKLNLPNCYFYTQNIEDITQFNLLIEEHKIHKFDIILSDLAPNTTGLKEIDAIRSILLLEKTLPIYENFLKNTGKFIIKIFMGPGFEEFINKLKKISGSQNIKTFKPDACRKESKEIYILKY